MDQMAALLAQAGHAVFLDCRSLRAQAVPLDVAADDLALLLVDTRVTHAHATGEYGARRRSCEQAARVLGVPALRDVTPDQLDAAGSELDPVTRRRAPYSPVAWAWVTRVSTSSSARSSAATSSGTACA